MPLWSMKTMPKPLRITVFVWSTEYARPNARSEVVVVQLTRAARVAVHAEIVKLLRRQY